MLTKEFVEKHKPVFKAVFKKFSEKKQQFIWDVTFGIGNKLVEFKWRAGTGWVMWARKANANKPIKFEHTRWGKNPLAPETGYNLKSDGVIPKPPSIDDILSCLSSDILLGMLPFDTFASDLGYNTDSRNDHKIWKICRDFAVKCTFTFPPEFLYDLKNYVEE